jgi:hypothetical protein
MAAELERRLIRYRTLRGRELRSLLSLTTHDVVQLERGARRFAVLAAELDPHQMSRSEWQRRYDAIEDRLDHYEAATVELRNLSEHLEVLGATAFPAARKNRRDA